MKVYGLTGGIASGKSEAGRRFEALGFPVIDADKIGHAVIAPGGSAEKAVVEAFGPEVLSYGKIDREKLGRRVFSDSAALRQLNGLVHPAIVAEIARNTSAFEDEGRAAILIDAALHAENGRLGPGLEALVVVLARPEERVRRLVELRGMADDEAKRRIAAQTPPENKVPLARWVIDNNGTIEQLREQVDGIARELQTS